MPKSYISAALFIAGDLEPHRRAEAFVFGSIPLRHPLPFDHFPRAQSFNPHRAVGGEQPQLRTAPDPFFYLGIRRPPLCKVMLLSQFYIKQKTAYEIIV